MSQSDDGQLRPHPFPRPTPVDPSPLLTELRDSEPVSRVVMPSGSTGYLVTRHADAQRVLSDPVFSLGRLWQPGAPQYAPGPLPTVGFSLASLDPPEHTHMRRRVSSEFSPRAVERMRPRVQQVTDELLDRMAAGGPPADLVPALCSPLPITVICQLFGVPEADRAAFREWTIMITTGSASDPSWRRAWHDLGSYVVGLVAAARREPPDSVLSTLVGAFGPRDTVTDFDLATLAIQVLVAGYQTTRDQLCTVIYVLLRDRDSLASLCTDPGSIPDAIEELLRMHPPDEPIIRVATEDTEIAGVTVCAGSPVLVDVAAANRDPAEFPNSEQTDLRRTNSNHLTFGHGPHFCLGAAVARVELQVVLNTVVRRLPTMRLAVDPVQTGQSDHGLLTLPVTW